MMRAFGFDKEAPTPAQYSFVENETKRIAQNLGWEPQQVQAAIWVALKSRMENPDVKKAVEAKSFEKGWMTYDEKGDRVVLDKNKHAANWLEYALRHSPTEADREAAKFDYADAAANNLAQISWESIPSRTSMHMPEIFEAPPEVVQDYHVQMSKAFLDDEGNDIIAKELEILSPGDFEAPGYFEQRVSPGTQTNVTVPRQYGVTRRVEQIKKQAAEEGWSKEQRDAAIRAATYATEPAAKDAMLAYAAARGILLKQDGVGMHRPAFISGLSRPKANGIQVDIGRPLTARETSELARLVATEAGHTEYNPIASPNGVRFINFDYLGAPNLDFQKTINRALEKMNFDNDEPVNAKMFGADTGYLGNNWTEKFNGEGYLDTGDLARRPDLQRKVRDIVARLAPRVSAVEDEFANRYNWTRNRQLNSAYEAQQEVGAAPVATPQGIESLELPTQAVEKQGTLGDALTQLNITPQRMEQWRASREGMRQERVPQVQEAAEALREGKITTEQYQQTVREYQPIRSLGAVQKMPTVEEIAMALGKNAEKSPGIVGVNVDLPNGTRVASRLDIPAYEKYDTWVVSLHDGNKTGGNAIAYGQAAVLNNVDFMSSAKAALNIATGKTAKGTIARMYGDWENRNPEMVAQQAQDILSGKAPDAADWAEVGMNPARHSYFYRKSDGMPVASAEQVIQVGPLVLAKKPVTRPVESPEHLINTPEGPRYFKKGGNVERVTNDNRKYF
jgi:hypothetical protein